MPSVMKEYLAKAGGAGRTSPDLCRKPASNNHLTLLTKPLGFSHGLLCGAEKLTQMVYLWPIRWRPSCWVCRACSAS
jgi:hypothetical protein